MIKITDIVDFNPSRKIARGTKTSFIEMAALPTGGRDVIQIDKKEFKGGGAKFQNGDTLFARITPCLENGKTAKVSNLESDEVAFGSTEFIVMAAIDTNYDEEFVYYLARLPEFRQYAASRMEGTSGRQRVAWQSLAEFNFNFPEKELRKTAASSLKTLDDKIAINQQINQTLEAMAQALFKSWFVDFEPTRAKMAVLETGGTDEDATLAAMTTISGKSAEELATLKTSNAEAYSQLHSTASLFPSRLIDSELGEIPEGWEVVPFSRMIKLIGGGTPKTSVSDYWGGNIPWFSVVDAPNESDVFVIDTEKKVTELGVEKSSTKILPVNTTIISARGTVGRVALVGAPMAMNQSCYGIQGDNMPDYYIHYCVRHVVSELKSRAHGSVFDTITRSTFETLQFAKPNSELANAYERVVAPLMAVIKHNLEQSQTLTQLRDALLPKLLSGEIAVDASSNNVEAV